MKSSGRSILTDAMAWVLFLILFSIGCSSEYQPDDAILSQLPETIDYNFHVQPILSDRCYRCHGPDEKARKADLRLDTNDGLMGKTTSGVKLIKPGEMAGALLHRITSDDPEIRDAPTRFKNVYHRARSCHSGKMDGAGGRMEATLVFYPS